MLGKVPGCPLSREWRLLVLSRERLVVFSRGPRTLAFPREQRSSGSRGLERMMHWWSRLPLNVVYAALTVGYMSDESVLTLILKPLLKPWAAVPVNQDESRVWKECVS